MNKKFCSKCSIEKMLCEFTTDKTHSDGYYSICKKCVNDKVREWYKNNKVKKMEYDRIYKIKNKNSIKARKQEYYNSIKNDEVYKSKRLKYYIVNKHKIEDKAKLYRAKKKGSLDYKIENEVRNFKRRKNGQVTKKILQMVYEYNIKKFGTLTCYLCGEGVLFGEDSIDHIIPISKGGTHEYNNLEVAHISCNKSKGNKTLDEFIIYNDKVNSCL